MPLLPDQHALAVLALFLFTREKLPLETSSLLVLVLLTVGFELFPYQHGTQTLHAIEFFTGFGHEALVAVCGLMIVGPGLLSAFLNNTPVVLPAEAFVLAVLFGESYKVTHCRFFIKHNHNNCISMKYPG